MVLAANKFWDTGNLSTIVGTAPNDYRDTDPLTRLKFTGTTATSIVFDGVVRTPSGSYTFDMAFVWRRLPAGSWTLYTTLDWSTATVGVAETRTLTLDGQLCDLEVDCMIAVRDVTGATPDTFVAPRYSAVVQGDSISVGRLASPQDLGWLPLTRRALGSNWTIAAIGFPGRRLAEVAANGTLISADVAKMTDRLKGTKRNFVLNALGTNDLGANATAATIGAQYEAYGQGMDAALASLPGFRHIIFTPIGKGNEGPNGVGATLTDYRNQGAIKCYAHGWVHVRGDTVLPLGDGSNFSESGASAVHPNNAGHQIIANYFTPLLQGLENMGTLSPYSLGALVDHVRNKTAYTPAATHYAAAFVNGVEVTGNNYSRASRPNDATTWAAAASRAKTNIAAFIFPNASGSWGSITEIRIYDAPTGGFELARNIPGGNVPISNTTGPLVVPIGEIDITAPTAGFSDTVVHEFEDLMFGGVANTARATVYGTYFNGAPPPVGSGTELSPTRATITQASTWGAATSGLAVTTAPITLAWQSSATHYAEYSALTGGVLLFSAALPLSASLGTGGIIPAGGLWTQLS